MGVLTLRFEDGTITLSAPADQLPPGLEEMCTYDARSMLWRAAAMQYATILRRLHGKVPYDDQARQYLELHLREQSPMKLRPYQIAAIDSWLAAKKRGVVVLPTGAGKSYVALRCIMAAGRSALVMAPTIDLVEQWRRDLSARLVDAAGKPVAVGQYGGGEHDLQPITIATYDSACLFMPHHGHRFGVLVADECHHLPAPMTRLAAESSIAPFRLGLSATPERADGGHAALDQLIGPEVHRSQITELEGRYLATYDAEVVDVAMEPDEARAYADARAFYLRFLRSSGVDLKQPGGWGNFLAYAGKTTDGRQALAAWREQKRLTRESRAKLRVCWHLLCRHAGERIIVFTDDNHTAYVIGSTMALPVLTHHSAPAERREFLDGFRKGIFPVLVTSKVLNEGVDVPEASVGIIVSGSGSVREHVQRLGRILRPGKDKNAKLYELISTGTGEGFTSERRRSHSAFGEEELWQS